MWCEHLQSLRIATRGNQRLSWTLLDRAATSTSTSTSQRRRPRSYRRDRELESSVKSFFCGFSRAGYFRGNRVVSDRPPREISYGIICSQRASFAVAHISGTRTTSFSESRNPGYLFHPGDLGERRPPECRQPPIQAPRPRSTDLAHLCDHRSRRFDQRYCNRNQSHCPA